MTPGRPIKVAVVEDDARIRRVLDEVFASARDFLCVGAFPNGSAALAKLPALKPEVIVMDINLPDLSGVEVTRLLMARQPGLKVIGLSAQADLSVVAAMIDAGAAGFVSKISAGQDLPEAIQDVCRNQTYFSPVLGINSRDDLATGHAGPDTPARRHGSIDPAGP
jgi:DNA-binding NarL/FixJ family response regulator